MKTIQGYIKATTNGALKVCQEFFLRLRVRAHTDTHTDEHTFLYLNITAF